MCFKMCFYGKMFTTSGKTDHRSHRGVAKKEQKLIRTQFHLLFFGTNNNTICFPPKKKAFFGGALFRGGILNFEEVALGGMTTFDSHDKLQSCKSQQILRKKKVAQRPRRLWWKKLRSKFCLSGAQQGFLELSVRSRGPLNFQTILLGEVN